MGNTTGGKQKPPGASSPPPFSSYFTPMGPHLFRESGAGDLKMVPGNELPGRQRFFLHFGTIILPCTLPQVLIKRLLKHFYNNTLKCLSEDHMRLLDIPISSEEVPWAIKRLKNGKLPGNDGFPVELYKRYSQDLVHPLTWVFNDLLTLGTAPPSWSEASVIVLPKKGRNLLDVKSYWPISLLNCDYKLFTAILSKRLNSIIACYSYTDQTGFIPNCNIMDNIQDFTSDIVL